ncbi:NUDIX domain-containing protein [Paenibacillus urinalis]|uniref:NUDIX domain-containing protein n=1 Tax=Paenibacillus urinalis TaxID=521520 RepID=UPI0019601099
MKNIDEFAYGGIVFNDEEQVLMRSPSNFWGGYVWTFAKGSYDSSDTTHEVTAVREVREETGYECRIVREIPGEFASDTCITKYFLMKPTGIILPYDKETQDVTWFGIEEAFYMIKLTKSEKGRNRDRDVLLSALKIKELLSDF